MLNLRPITFIIGLVLSKLALFMYVPTLVAFLLVAAVFSISRKPSSLPIWWLFSA